MKLNIAYPRQGTQKQFDIEDELTLRPFYDKRIAQEVSGDSLGENWKGYIFRITGGSDKDGFPMRQGVMTTKKVHLLLKAGSKGYRCKRDGVRKRKYVRGCIVDANLSVLSMVIVKKGEHEIEGLTDVTVPRRLGPKRAGKIIKMFNLEKEDDVRRFVLRRPAVFKNKEKQEAADAADKKKFKSPKIQRLITPVHLQRRRRIAAAKSARSLKNKTEREDFNQLLKKIKHDNENELRRKHAQNALDVKIKSKK